MANKISHRMVVIEDPGHAWLRVPVQDLVLLHLHEPGKISPYSFIGQEVNRWYAFLEEDLDYGVFLKACDEHEQKRPVIKTRRVNRFQRPPWRFGDEGLDEFFAQFAVIEHGDGG